MSGAFENNCTVLVHRPSSKVQREAEIRKNLENKDDKIKIQAMEELLMGMLNGENYPKILMSVIKYTIHSENHTIKKLVLLYWEICEKKNNDGSLLHEMILVW